MKRNGYCVFGMRRDNNNSSTEAYMYSVSPFMPTWEICQKMIYRLNGCGMPTEDAYSSGHLVLSHFGTCMCSNVETNLSWTCLVSGPLNFEHPSVLLFCLFFLKHWSQNSLLHNPFWRYLVLALLASLLIFSYMYFILLRITDEGSVQEVCICPIS